MSITAEDVKKMKVQVLCVERLLPYMMDLHAAEDLKHP